MFGWIPIIGSLIDGVVSIFKGRQDLSAKTDANDIEEIRARLALQAVLKDDIGVRFSRDLILFPVSFWIFLYTYDQIVVLRYPSLVWGVAPLQGTMEYLPFVVLAFLFGLNIRKMFK